HRVRRVMARRLGPRHLRRHVVRLHPRRALAVRRGAGGPVVLRAPPARPAALVGGAPVRRAGLCPRPLARARARTTPARVRAVAGEPMVAPAPVAGAVRPPAVAAPPPGRPD